MWSYPIIRSGLTYVIDTATACTSGLLPNGPARQVRSSGPGSAHGRRSSASREVPPSGMSQFARPLCGVAVGSSSAAAACRRSAAASCRASAGVSAAQVPSCWPGEWPISRLTRLAGRSLPPRRSRPTWTCLPHVVCKPRCSCALGGPEISVPIGFAFSRRHGLARGRRWKQPAQVLVVPLQLQPPPQHRGGRDLGDMQKGSLALPGPVHADT
jgi:hypothetical protein